MFSSGTLCPYQHAVPVCIVGPMPLQIVRSLGSRERKVDMENEILTFCANLGGTSAR